MHTTNTSCRNDWLWPEDEEEQKRKQISHE